MQFFVVVSPYSSVRFIAQSVFPGHIRFKVCVFGRFVKRIRAMDVRNRVSGMRYLNGRRPSSSIVPQVQDDDADDQAQVGAGGGQAAGGRDGVAAAQADGGEGVAQGEDGRQHAAQE